MKSRIVFHSVLAIAAMALITGCRSSKKATTDTPDVNTTATTVQTVKNSDESIVAAVAANRQTTKGLRSKVSIRLNYDGRSASASGQLKMKRDEIIQVAVYALGIMEVGRLELTPQYLLVLDRVNKQYLQVAWDEVPELAQAGVDFSTFQALFWNELFVPGISGTPATSDFKVERENSTLKLTPKTSRANTKKVAVDFLVGSANSLIQQTNVLPTDNKTRMSFKCNYSDWSTLAQKKFPQEILLSVVASNKNYSLKLSSSSLQTDESLGNLYTRVSTGYKRVTLDQIIRMLAQ
ncbi:MAG: DUF4292 domain-containing protein [Bacteroidales bacterium]|nr:DUF4292 domain-containing protein [Bacteroidales bacterium]